MRVISLAARSFYTLEDKSKKVPINLSVRFIATVLTLITMAIKIYIYVCVTVDRTLAINKMF